MQNICTLSKWVIHSSNHHGISFTHQKTLNAIARTLGQYLYLSCSKYIKWILNIFKFDYWVFGLRNIEIRHNS